MAKGKPIKGLLKRVRITRNGKVVATSAGSQHRRVVKSPKQRRRLKGTSTLPPAAAKQVKNALGK